MTKYAEHTIVSPEKSLQEIRQILKRYNATKFGMIEEADGVGIGFEMRDRRVRFMITLPKEGSVKVKVNGSNTTVASQPAYEKSIRQRWRALVLVIKAKLEAVESGIETFEEAFMAQLVLPNGQTVGEWAAPQIAAAYTNNRMPPLLPSG